MKKLVCGLNSGYDDWQAMLPIDFNLGGDLVQILENGSWKPKAWESNEVIPFILVGKRTFDLSAEEVEELGYDGFEQKYPFGKPIYQAGTNGEEFRDILEWGANPIMEPPVFETPKNGGSGVYRIISPKMKKILEQFHLPPHRFYLAEVTHEITGEKRPYYLFHLTYESGNHLDNSYCPVMESFIYKEGEFDYDNWVTTDDIILHKFEKGSIKDFDNYQKQYQEYIRNLEDIPLDREFDLNDEDDYEIWSEKLGPYKGKENYYVFQESLDLMGLSTEIMISNQLKETLDQEFPGQEWGYKLSDDHVEVVTGYQPGEELPF